MCFKRTEVIEVVPNVPICKACNYATKKLLDFFAFYGYGLSRLPSVDDVDGKGGFDAETEARKEEEASKTIERRVKTRDAGKKMG